MNSTGYQKVLNDTLMPLIARFPHIDWILQQDNASVHSSESTKLWLEQQNIQVLPWPSRSPDLNCIENVWSMLARHVYDDCRQFNDIEQLRGGNH